MNLFETSCCLELVGPELIGTELPNLGLVDLELPGLKLPSPELPSPEFPSLGLLDLELPSFKIILVGKSERKLYYSLNNNDKWLLLQLFLAIFFQMYTLRAPSLVTQPILQLRPNWSLLRSMDLYNQIFCRFQKCNQKVPPPSLPFRRKKKRRLG